MNLKRAWSAAENDYKNTPCKEQKDLKLYYFLRQATNSSEAKRERLGFNQDVNHEAATYVLREWKTKSDLELGAELDMSTDDIKKIRKHLRITRARTNVWNSLELECLRDSWGMMDNTDISLLIGRSEDAIIQKARDLNLLSPAPLEGLRRSDEILPVLCLKARPSLFRDLKAYNLPVQRIHDGHKNTIYFNMSLLHKWLRDYPHLWNSRKLPLEFFGAEDEWFTNKRETDLQFITTGISSSGAIENQTHKDFLLSQQIDPLYNEDSQRKKQICRLVDLLSIQKNKLMFGEFWQRQQCVFWNDVKGCSANNNDCDRCIHYSRIKE